MLVILKILLLGTLLLFIWILADKHISDFQLGTSELLAFETWLPVVQEYSSYSYNLLVKGFHSLLWQVFLVFTFKVAMLFLISNFNFVYWN